MSASRSLRSALEDAALLSAGGFGVGIAGARGGGGSAAALGAFACCEVGHCAEGCAWPRRLRHLVRGDLGLCCCPESHAVQLFGGVSATQGVCA